ncbi:MAG: radical SAM protein [Clostridia bacterium]|nr:radical SAM protein [Clostridia bacterium]
MTIGLHDSDNTGFPNLALMKLSTYHKGLGDAVEWWNPLLTYDRVYSSKVFTYTPECAYLPENTIKGGTGYGLYTELPPEIDQCFPDYSIYPKCDYAIGFLTRGCIRNCPWCVVPKKEGKIRGYNTWRNIKRPDSKNIVFMDNNILACQWGLDQIMDMAGEDVRVDFNQGIDARLITPEIAEMLGNLKWIRFVRMACDTDAMLDTILDRATLLEKHGIKRHRLFIYCLVQGIHSAEARCIALRDAGLVPFAQPYRDFENNLPPTKEAMNFARWVNHKAAFKSCKTFSEYNSKIRGHRGGGLVYDQRI